MIKDKLKQFLVTVLPFAKETALVLIRFAIIAVILAPGLRLMKQAFGFPYMFKDITWLETTAVLVVFHYMGEIIQKITPKFLKKD